MKLRSKTIGRVLALSLVILIWATAAIPASAAGLELVSLELTCNGQTETVRLKSGLTSYNRTYYVAKAPVEVTLSAQAPADCYLSIDGVDCGGDKGSSTQVINELGVFNIQIYSGSGSQSQLYLVYIYVNYADPPAGSDGITDSGTIVNSGGNANGDANGNSSGDNNGGNATGGGTIDNSGGNNINAETGGQAAPGQTANAPAHLIFYIDAPFFFANDILLQADTAPYLVTDAAGGGYTMVPVRFIAEALGASVGWDPVERSVDIDLDGRHFKLIIGQLVPATPVAAVIKDSRTFVPLRYVMESFGATVTWSQAERRIDIYYTPAK